MVANRNEAESEVIEVVSVREPCPMAVQERLARSKRWADNVVRMPMDRIVVKGVLKILHTSSLRLIAVVESKSALMTKRLRRILMRSIPKPTQLGIFSILVLLVVAGGWLSTAKANPRSSQSSDASIPVSQELSGRVIDPKGQAVAGAQVGLNGAGTPVRVYNGVLEVDWPVRVEGQQIVETNASGRFRFEYARPDPFYVLAAHERGFALVSGKEFKKNPEVRLERWGRIEGQVAKGREGTDHRVWMVGLPNPAWLWQKNAFRYDTAHGADGRFVFERVPAGWFEVGYLTPIGDDCEGLTSRTPVEVKAGETAKVELGGRGRPVIGRFVPPASYGRPVYFGAGVRALHSHEELDRKQEQWRQQWQQASEHDPYAPHNVPFYMPRTTDYGMVIKDNQRKWSCLWSESPQYDAYVDYALWSDANWRGYAFRVSLDGSFRIEDVIPGEYSLIVDLKERQTSSIFGEPFAKYRGTIKVPFMTEPYTERPLDLGTLTLDMRGVGGRNGASPYSLLRKELYGPSCKMGAWARKHQDRTTGENGDGGRR